MHGTFLVSVRRCGLGACATVDTLDHEEEKEVDACGRSACFSLAVAFVQRLVVQLMLSGVSLIRMHRISVREQVE